MHGVHVQHCDLHFSERIRNRVFDYLPGTCGINYEFITHRSVLRIRNKYSNQVHNIYLVDRVQNCIPCCKTLVFSRLSIVPMRILVFFFEKSQSYDTYFFIHYIIVRHLEL